MRDPDRDARPGRRQEPLTDEEIARADAVILAADAYVDTREFAIHDNNGYLLQFGQEVA